MFSIDAIKPNVEKKFKTVFFTQMYMFSGGESGAHKIKPVCFFLRLVCWRQQKHH